MTNDWWIALILWIFLHGQWCCHHHHHHHHRPTVIVVATTESLPRPPSPVHDESITPTTTTTTTGSTSRKSTVTNDRILMDSIQINPGDIYIGLQQQTKYNDPQYIQSRGYTARSTSMEQSPALCMTYHKADRVVPMTLVDASQSSSSSYSDTNDFGVFQDDRNSTVWVTTYCQGIRRVMKETVAAGLDIFFFTDMIVFPMKLLELYPEVMHIDNSTQKVSIVYNNYTEYLLQIMFDEWMERFPLTSGIVVRTGETYTFDTPYHTGSSPIATIHNVTDQNGIWVQYINVLRHILCVRYQIKVIFRTWFSITDPTSYLEITNQISPHHLLYFSIKHTSGDFFRQMSPNSLLQIGQHAQIIEVQIQREYEGKGSYPLYLFEHVVLNDISSGSNHSLSQLFPDGCYNTTSYNHSTIIRGLWTWSRGGGWWGPYIHGAEFWIDFNLHLFVSWWNHDHCMTTIDTIPTLFQRVCYDTLLLPSYPGYGNPYSTMIQDMNTTVMSALNNACTNFHDIMRLSDQALLYGRYCLEVKGAYGNCWIWTRDDRIGGLNELQAHLNYIRNDTIRITESLWYKQQSLQLWKQATQMYETNVSSTFRTINPHIDRQIQNSFLYAQSYFGIIEAAWRALIYGTLTYDSNSSDHLLLKEAILDYDASWNMFRAVALTTPEFPSLYKGTYWNFPFEQENEGMDATINRLRKLVVVFHDETDSVSFQ